jgi:hypothetical protein
MFVTSIIDSLDVPKSVSERFGQCQQQHIGTLDRGVTKVTGFQFLSGRVAITVDSFCRRIILNESLLTEDEYLLKAPVPVNPYYCNVPAG